MPPQSGGAGAYHAQGDLDAIVNVIASLWQASIGEVTGANLSPVPRRVAIDGEMTYETDPAVVREMLMRLGLPTGAAEGAPGAVTPDDAPRDTPAERRRSPPSRFARCSPP